MGDTGALSLGAAVGTMALMVKKGTAPTLALRHLFPGDYFSHHANEFGSSTHVKRRVWVSEYSRWPRSIIILKPTERTKRKLCSDSG